MGADDLDFRLLNDFQRGFPLVSQPWQALAAQLGCDAEEIVARLLALQSAGKIARVGPVFAPNRIGASTLAAMAVPPDELPRIAEIVNAFPGVNHNYRREHHYNLWFVAAAADQAALATALAQMGAATGCPPISLPLVEEFHIDLGFDLTPEHTWGRRTRRTAEQTHTPRRDMSAAEWRLIQALHDGLPWQPQPFQSLAAEVGLCEEEVLHLLDGWLQEGLLRRFGVVVRHRELGYRANAMCVWAVPEAQVSALGHRLAAQEGVNLCYRRASPGPEWPYTLFCMIHGRDRAAVERRRVELCAAVGLVDFPSAVLFSTDCYKQCGARYRPAAVAASVTCASTASS